MKLFTHAATLALLFTTPVNAGETVTYATETTALSGYQTQTDNAAATIVIFHTFGGLTDFEKTRAQMFTDAGYNAFAADLYGLDVQPTTRAEKQGAMAELFSDRQELQARLRAAIDQAATLGADKIIIMGYSMGGGAIMELLYSGLGSTLGVDGYGVFFGRVSDQMQRAIPDMTAPIFVAHGKADTILATSDLMVFAEDLDFTNTQYQIEVYPEAGHMFSVSGHPNYDADADVKSWQAFLNFIENQS